MSTKVLLVRTGNIIPHQFSFNVWKMLYSKLPVRKVYKPFGIMLLAECIERAGFECDILDLMTCKPSKKEKIILKMANKYSIIGFSFSAIGYLEALKMARLCKEVNPECKIIFGGPHASFLYKDILKNYNFVDFVIVGEGEESIIDLLTKDKETEINNLAYRNGEKIILTSKKLTDINLLPIVKKECKSLYFKYRYFEYMETSRGCPFKCTYCVESRFFPRIRFKSNNNVFEQMKFYHDHKKKNIMFIDSNFSLSENHVKNICELIKKGDFDFKNIFVQMRADLTTLEMLKAMKNKGFYLSFGVESLSEDVLRSVNKTPNPANYIKKYIRLLKFCKKLDLPVQSNYILPLPEQKVYKVIKEIKLLQKFSTVGLNLLTPYPGTPIWDKHKDEIKNLDLNTFDCEHVILRNGMDDKNLKNIFKFYFSANRHITSSIKMLVKLLI